jgi:hypothetical protein
MTQGSAETQPDRTSDDYSGGFIDYFGGIEIEAKFKKRAKALFCYDRVNNERHW